MQTMLMLVGLSIVLQLFVWVPGIWHFRKYTSLLAALFIICSTFIAFIVVHKALSVLLIYLMALSAFNMARIAKGRMNEHYMYTTTLRTFTVLSILQILVATILVASIKLDWSAEHWFLGFSVIVLALQVMLSISLHRHLRQINHQHEPKHFTDHELPTVTVAIPARNETADLDACLQSLIDSDYPKLEIIVLDDCSQQKQTPEIIKSFAHDGVRFLAGKPAPDGWLAKNYAYAQLLEAASGDYVLFCGVDTRFSSSTVRDIVRQAITRNKVMMSVMPINMRPEPFQLESLLTQPIRYAWELMLPRRRFASPSILSTCWIANKGYIAHAGGFAAVRRMIIPEAYLARKATRQNDGYSFIASNAQIGLFCSKDLNEQRRTLIRTRYPQLHRKPEMVGLQALSNAAINFAPLLVVVVAGILGWYMIMGIAALASILACVNYVRVVRQTYQNTFISAYIAQPLAVIYDVAVIHYSMWQYEFKDVIWKDRNVCVPVMRVEPHLPRLP